MLDRQKGSLPAFIKKFPYTLSLYCYKHLIDNVKAKFKKAYIARFQKCAYAITKDDFQECLNEILGPYKKYINDIPYKAWTMYVFPIPCYRQITNNFAESLNSGFAEIRALPPLLIVDVIY